MGSAVGSAAAAVPPGDEPGVTLRAFQMTHGLTGVCTIKAGQTPNVDVLRQTIDWSTPNDFGGLEDQFLVHALANLTIDTAGTYTFQLTSDDGSILKIDDKVVVDHDGLHGATAKEGTVSLSAGVHKLRIDFIEATGGQQLTLAWKKPGDGSFTTVPNSVLSTEAGVTRVTAPGGKQCEGEEDTGGDGLQLNQVNPAYDLINLRPDGFEPQVSGLEWMGDDLLVLTWGGNNNNNGDAKLGELYKLTGVKNATGPADVTKTLLADGLWEPMGVSVVDGDIYVAEKDQLIKLTNPNPEGKFQGKTNIASFPHDGNFHEFSFGMLYKDGLFHLNLSVSINYGGATTVPQGSMDRGTHITVNKSTGEIKYVAGGLRTPHGMGWGPEGEIFTTDNQGAWLPASKLVQIKPGAFYNHFTTQKDGSPGRFDDQPVTKPVLWMPQNEIANSPSTPIYVDKGPYAGQVLIGDVTYGGLQRGFLEKVDGDYQGALFRMSQGFEAGVSRVLKDDDGSLYLGGIGAGGNWGQTGKLRYGLQKIKLNGQVPFDMSKMEVVPGGFKVSYTKPLSAETLTDLATKYQFAQWTYKPTAQYGGPKMNQEELEVASATASADGKSVTILVDGMKPDRVVYMRSPRPFSAVGGEPLFSTEAWYTLNNYPGYTPEPPAPAPFGLYEWEQGELTGSAGVANDHAGYTGSGFVGGLGNNGAGSTIKVIVNEAGKYDVAIRYANGPNPESNRTKTISLYVNGVRQTLSLPTTTSWKTWESVVKRLDLNAGENTIQIIKESADYGHVNLDSALVKAAVGVRYEAEAAARAGGASIANDHPNYSGTGFVGGLNTDQNPSVTFTVDAAAAGQQGIVLGYANGPHPFAGDKTMTLYVNGEKVKQLTFPTTGDWPKWSTLTQNVTLNQGSNTIMIRRDAGDSGSINLDYLDLVPAAATCDAPASPDDEFDGTALDTCRWTTIRNPSPTLEVKDGKLRIAAQAGDISGGVVDAKNVVMQPAPADGTWAATTSMTLAGSDNYLQGGLVAWTSATDYAKFVAMRTPEGPWVLELGRRIDGQMVYVNSPQLPRSPKDLQLQMVNTGKKIQGRYSLDGGATWKSMGGGYPNTGLVNPTIGLAAYNGTGQEIGQFDWFRVSEPVIEPDTCEASVADPGYRMLFDGTEASMEDWRQAGPGFFTREDDCSIMSHGGMGLFWHKDALEGDYSLQLDWKLKKDDNSGVFVGFPDPGNDPWVAVNKGYEIQIDATDAVDRTTGAIYTFQSADLPARDAALKPVNQWNHYEILVEGKRIRLYLNDVLVNDFTSTDPARMNWPSYFGIQQHGSGENVHFRDIQIKELADPENVASQVTITPDPATLEVGKTGKVKVTVDSLAKETPTGNVTLTVNGTALAPASLVNGVATFDVGPFSQAGTVDLKASYAGDVAHDPGSATGSLKVVAKVVDPTPPTTPPTPAAKPQLSVGKKVADANKSRTKAVVKAKCSGSDCSGKAVLKVKGKKVGAGKVAIKVDRHGKIVLKLNKRARALLAKKAKVKAVLTVKFTDGTTQRIKLRLTR